MEFPLTNLDKYLWNIAQTWNEKPMKNAIWIRILFLVKSQTLLSTIHKWNSVMPKLYNTPKMHEKLDSATKESSPQRFVGELSKLGHRLQAGESIHRTVAQSDMSVEELEQLLGGAVQNKITPTTKSGGIPPNHGLQHPRAILFLVLWYLFSASTLFLNKYILTYQKADPYFLCGMQMLITMMCGFFQLKYPLGTYTPVVGQRKPSKFYTNMIIIGLLQLGTILFGLIALYFVAVSFAETVKSSAPIFTVFIARFFLGEKTGLFVFLSLFPIMMGLALCSAHELSFHFLGFLCAMGANLSECIQSVISKSLLSDKSYIYSPAQLQFYPNLAAVIIQCSVWYFFVNFSKLYSSLSIHLLITVILDGISFHGQTITAYVLMSHISPVTYSVANTTKRAFLIWFSILLFSNPVTFYSGLGTAIVIMGVLLYSRARDIDARKRLQFSITEESLNDIR